MKHRTFSKKVIEEYQKGNHLNDKYNRKQNEITNAIKIIDKIKNPNIASYNITKGHDQNGMGCYLFRFIVKYNENNVCFSFHIPRSIKTLYFGNNNYPKIKSSLTSNSPALSAVANDDEIFTSGLSLLELYA